MVISQNRRLKVFLCHAKDDKPAVRRLYDSLLVNEVDAWLDEEKLMPGQNWQQEIPKAVKSSDIVILCLSKSSINKEGYIQKEIKFALDIANEKSEGSIYIIPAKLEECDVPDKFSLYQWVNLFEKKGYERLLGALSLRAEQIDAALPRKNADIFSLPKSMGENAEKYPFQFREEVVNQIFKLINSGESFYIIGTPNVGQSRLMDYLLGNDLSILESGQEVDHDRVKKKYLGEAISNKTWLVRVDMHRMRHETGWGFQFYELLLHSLLLASNRISNFADMETLVASLASLDSQVIQSKDDLMAHRLFEMAITRICQVYKLKLCFIFDNFDEAYQAAPREIFSQLRAIRDANRYHICYGLFLRNLPEILRDPIENEFFYELIERNMVGVGPYSQQDTLYFIKQLESRHGHPLSSEISQWIYENSGGHPGIFNALFMILRDIPDADQQRSNTEWFITQPLVQMEMRKIWASFSEDEKNGLLKIVTGNANKVNPIIYKILLAKGLLRSINDTIALFSPLLTYYLSIDNRLK